MKNLKFLSILLLTALSVNLSYAQTKKADKKAAKIATINRIITAKKFVFVANMAIPMSMQSVQLNGQYDVTVNNDSLIVYLPYYGRAYTAPRDAIQGGFKLTTTKFDYKAVPGKKGGWDITIVPPKSSFNDVKDIQKMNFRVGAEGYASLQVTSLNRQPISFNGVIEEVRTRK
jgi:hypothetical protein